MLRNIVQTLHGHRLGIHGLSFRPVVKSSILVSALSAILFAGRHYFETQFVKPAHLSPVPLYRGLCQDSGQGRVYCIRPGICDHLSDSEWESLPIDPTFRDFKDAIDGLVDCKAVTEKLEPQLTKDFRRVVAKMGHPYPDAFSVKITNKVFGPEIDDNNTLSIPSSDAYSWWDIESSPFRKEIRGSFAHEAAHRILKHHEKRKDVSWSDSDWYATARIQEKEADLQTLRVPEYARGHRDRLLSYEISATSHRNRLIKLSHCDQRPLTLVCDSFLKTNDPKSNLASRTHPPLHERIAYLTDAICAKYSSLNQDICQDTTATDLKA